MSVVSDFRERIEKAFQASPRGVLGLADDLLDLGQQEGLMLTWGAGRCCVRSLNNEPRGMSELNVPKSVFRGVLARVAALCNEQTPGSVSPYGGEAELTPSGSRTTALRIAFVNCPGEQWLRIERP